jgi:hypothetical protein
LTVSVQVVVACDGCPNKATLPMLVGMAQNNRERYYVPGYAIRPDLSAAGWSYSHCPACAKRYDEERVAYRRKAGL